MAPGHRSSRVKPSEVAADTKRNFIPLVKASYAEAYPPFSVLYPHPTTQLEVPRRTLSTRPPAFVLVAEDPVTAAISYGAMDSRRSQAAGGGRVRVPFICAANERRPGGDWETGCAGYEERLCRRSNLSATLSSPWPGSSPAASHYPIPSAGGVMSDAVVVCRGPHDRYEQLERWCDLPVVSVPPTRWPKLRDNGARYSFAAERALMRDKMRGALRICLFHGYDRVVVGDFGLGNSCRNPPREVAELWRDVLLFDPDLRGRFAYVVFAFEDAAQSTTRLILDDMARRERKGAAAPPPPEPAPAPAAACGLSRAPTDLDIFRRVFDPDEVRRVLGAPDPRYKLEMITS